MTGSNIYLLAISIRVFHHWKTHQNASCHLLFWNSSKIVSEPKIFTSRSFFLGVCKKFVTYTEKVHPQKQQKKPSEVWRSKNNICFSSFQVVFCSPARSEDKNDYQATLVVKEKPMGFFLKMAWIIPVEISGTFCRENIVPLYNLGGSNPSRVNSRGILNYKSRVLSRWLP